MKTPTRILVGGPEVPSAFVLMGLALARRAMMAVNEVDMSGGSLTPREGRRALRAAVGEGVGEEVHRPQSMVTYPHPQPLAHAPREGAHHRRREIGSVDLSRKKVRAGFSR